MSGSVERLWVVRVPELDMVILDIVKRGET